MSKKHFILIFTLLLTLLSSAQDKTIKCYTGPVAITKTIASKITAYNTTTSATTKISGTIQTTSIVEGDTLTQNCAYCNVLLKDVKTQKGFGVVTNTKGEFELSIPASQYTVELHYVGFNTISITNLNLPQNTHATLAALMGQGNSIKNYRYIKGKLVDNTNE